MPVILPAESGVTQLLQSWRSGDRRAGEDPLARVYETLRAIASSQLRGELAGAS